MDHELTTITEITENTLEDFIAWTDRSEKTTKSYLTNLRQFVAWMHYAGIRRPARPDIVAYRDYLTHEHDAIALTSTPPYWTYRTDASGQVIRLTCSANTAAQYLRSVCQFFRWTASVGIYPNIADQIHAPKVCHDGHRRDALKPQEVAEIEASIDADATARRAAAKDAVKDAAGKAQRAQEQGARMKAIYLLAVTAGLRCIEISRANVGDLEIKGGQTYLWINGKGHAEADTRKAIAPEVADAINAYLAGRGNLATSQPLFTATGNRSGGQRLAPETISKMLKHAMQAAGYDSPRLTAHSLRHTAGTACMEITGNIYATQRYMRHADPKTTEIYVHDTQVEADAGIAARLYGLYHGADDAPEASSRQRLDMILSGMTDAQVARLAGALAAMGA